jgi:hypothetical protein
MSGLATPIQTPEAGLDSGYNVIMEVWCRDREVFKAFRDMKDPVFQALVAEDAENFLDREPMVVFTVDEVDSKEGHLAFKP